MQVWLCVYEILADETVLVVSATVGSPPCIKLPKCPPILWLKTVISWILILIAVQIIIQFVINMAKYVILTLILKPNNASNPTVPKHLKSFDGVACQLNWSSFVQIGWFCQ